MREPRFDPRKIYRFDDQKKAYIIDIDLDFYRELYSEWDFSLQHKRDLDEDLLDYLMECCDELPGKSPLVIAINLPDSVYDATRESRATEGFQHFFTYRIRRENNRYRRYYSKIIKYLCLGAILLVIASIMENIPISLPHSDLLVEGLIIGAWVSMWEVFSVLFFKLADHRKKINVYRRLKDAEIVYRYRSTPEPAHATPDEFDL